MDNGDQNQSMSPEPGSRPGPEFQLKSNPPVYGSEDISEYTPPPIEAQSAPNEKPFAFALAHGTDGASIWYGQLMVTIVTFEFEQITVDKKKVNSFGAQGPIGTVNVLAPENLDGDTLLQTHLGWYGDVYLYWEANDQGDVSLCDVRGPDTPEGQNISSLGGDLMRDTTDGQFYVKLGTVDEDSPVVQLVSSDVYWTLVAATGTISSEDEESSGELKSSAIVPNRLSPTKFSALFTVEAPEVLFFDVKQAPCWGNKTVYEIDPWFIEVCEPGSIVLVSACANRACMIGGDVYGPQVVVEVETMNGPMPDKISYLLSGTRRGFKGLRNAMRDLEQFLANDAFISSAYPAKDFSHLDKK